MFDVRIDLYGQYFRVARRRFDLWDFVLSLRGMVCFKKSYQNKSVAIGASKFVGKKYKKEFRAYYCKICNTWHLTTMSLSEYQRIKNKFK